MLAQLSEEQAGWLWSAAMYEQAWKPEVREKVRETLASSGTEMASWLLAKGLLREASVPAVRQLEAQLATHTERNLLRDITMRVRVNLPRFPLARVAIEVKRAANPINPDVYTAFQLRASQELREALRRGYKLKREQASELSVSERIGLLLLSAAHSGGLLDAEQLHALTRIKSADIKWLAGLPEVRLTLAIMGDKTGEYRQWFPDPATLALLVRHMGDLNAETDAGSLKRNRLHRYVNDFLIRVDVPVQYHPTSLKHMLLLVRMQWQLRRSQLLIGFAGRDYVSHSLRPTNWGGMLGCHQQSDPEGIYAEIARGVQENPDEVPPWVTTLCKWIRWGELPAKGFEQAVTGSVQQLMYSWAEYMLSPASPYKKRKGRQLTKDTVATYVRTLGTALDSFLDGQNVFEQGSMVLETVYENALDEQANEKKRRTMGSAIREFHDYLYRVHQMPPISRYSVLSGSRSVTRVDARILSEEQYQDALRELESCGLEVRTPRLVLAAKLLLILGYRLGLRRSEALMLQLADVQVPGLSAEAAARVQRRHPNMPQLADATVLAELPVDLIIRPNYERRLKTLNSVRRLPLRALLEPSELALLLDWYKQRNWEEATNSTSPFLFCIPELRSRWISEDCLIPAIHACMRSVTGCEEMRFHHLRHSCATWLTLKLMNMVSNRNAGLLLGELERTCEWLEDTGRLKRTLFPGPSGPTRKVLHIVSAIMGHGRPKTTLLHYVHSMPWIVALSWQWSADVWLFNAHNLATIAGVSEPRRTTQTDEEYMLTIIGRIGTLRHLKAERRRRAVRRVEPIQNDWAIQRIRRVEAFLSYVDYAEKTGHRPEMDSFEFSDTDRHGMLERARYIRELPQHRLKISLHAQGRSLTPERPQSGVRTDLVGYAQRLYQILEGTEAQRANRVVDLFIERCWETETTLRFYRDRDEEMAKDYLWLLKAMGIKGRDIELIIYDTKKPTKTTAYWRRHIGGPRTEFVKHAPENSDLANQHLGIRPVLRGKDGQELYHFGSALRYLLIMASIDWHLRL